MTGADLAKALMEFLRLAPRYMAALAVVAAFLLFSTDDLLKRLGVFDFTQQNRPAIGMTLLVSAALLGVSLSSGATASFRRWRANRRFFFRVVNRLHTLTEDEKQILRYYLAKNTRANTLRVDDGVVQGLVADGLIHRSAAIGNMVEGFAHNINDLVWDYIHLHPVVLEGTTNTYRTDKRDW
jgi:hypothetical protein